MFVISCPPRSLQSERCSFSCSSTVSGSRWVIFSSLSFIHIDLLLGNTLVIFYSPDCVKTNCPLCTHISVYLCFCALVFVSERSIVGGVSARFRATMVCSILKNPWNYFCLCLSGLIAVDRSSPSKSLIDFPTHGYMRIDVRPGSANRQRLSLCVCVWRLTVRMACLPFCGHSRLTVQTFQT